MGRHGGRAWGDEQLSLAALRQVFADALQVRQGPHHGPAAAAAARRGPCTAASLGPALQPLPSPLPLPVPLPFFSGCFPFSPLFLYFINPLCHSLAYFNWRVFLNKVKSFYGNFFLIRPASTKFSLTSYQNRAWICINK